MYERGRSFSSGESVKVGPHSTCAGGSFVYLFRFTAGLSDLSKDEVYNSHLFPLAWSAWPTSGQMWTFMIGPYYNYLTSSSLHYVWGYLSGESVIGPNGLACRSYRGRDSHPFWTESSMWSNWKVCVEVHTLSNLPQTERTLVWYTPNPFDRIHMFMSTTKYQPQPTAIYTYTSHQATYVLKDRVG